MADRNPKHDPAKMQYGYTQALDFNGDIVDISASLAERYSNAGYIWRIEFPRTSIAAGATGFLSFKTPATGICFYPFITVDKSGDLVDISLVEGGTFAGGSAVTCHNYNRWAEVLAGATCPLSSVSQGNSAGGATLTGGTTIFNSFIGGTRNGGTKSGGQSRNEGAVVLLPNTVYTVKMAVTSGTTNVSAYLPIVCIPYDLRPV